MLNDFNADFGWLEKAISENYIKYYEYAEFTNKKEISSCSNGNVSRANWKDSDVIMILKHSFNLNIKEIVNEVNLNYFKYYKVFFFYH